MTDLQARIELAAQLAGVEWFQYQLDAFEEWESLPGPKRMCLYYRTGAGKSLTALALLHLSGLKRALVIAPPITHKAWQKTAKKLGMVVETISHAKFRKKDYQTSRTLPIIADEFHLFGGQQGMGWKKMSRVAKGLQAPMILASATPNYNDAERVYCIQAVLDPTSTRGGFLQFLYQNCHTRQNPFGMIPSVDGFLHHADAAEYLQQLKGVVYVPDLWDIEPIDVLFQIPLPAEFETYGLDLGRRRILASQIEERHRRGYLYRVAEDHPWPRIHEEILEALEIFIDSQEKPILIFSNSSTLADLLFKDLHNLGISCDVITGKTNKTTKDRIVEQFKQGRYKVLIGTATLATGLDGLDKVSDGLVIFDDTYDDSLRKQVIGRILPRGSATDVSDKVVLRYVFE